jgi:8-oxo-dGTP pyrophosphatase MutT (NUDIX family)
VDTAPIPRPAARALMVDQHQRLLLFGTEEWRPGTTLWIPPGGGVNPGESFEDAVIREVWEETGLRGVEVGACVWTRSHVFHWQEKDWQAQERYFIVRCETFTPSRDNLEAHEETFLAHHRWWDPAEMAASKDYFVPRRLAMLLPPLLAGEVPAEPFDCGV